MNHASFYADRHLLVDILETLLDELKKTEVPVSKGPRILLTGSTLAMGDYKVLDLIEEAGASVVVEEFGEGVRDYWENVEADGDLIRALADRYFMKRVPPAFFRPGRERLDFLVKLTKEFSADGIIWYQLLYRDSYDIESFYFPQILKKERDIPMLKIESDYDTAETGPFRTRIETFVETLRAR